MLRNSLAEVTSLVGLLLATAFGQIAGADPPECEPGVVVMRFAAAAMPDSGTVETEPASFGVACVDSIISGLEAPRTEKFVPTYTRHLTDAGQRLERMFVLYYDDDTDPYEVVAALSLCSELEAVSVSELAEPSGCGTYRHEPTDTYFVSGAQWNLDNEADDGTDIDAPEAWYIERGNNVVIGIVDGGTMLAIDQWGLHEDIAYFYNSAEDKDPLGVFNAADLDGQDSPLDSDSEADNVIGWNFWDPPRLAEEAAKQEWRVRPLNAVLCDPHYIPNPWRILKCAPHGFSVESIAVAKDDGGESLVGVAPAARVYHARTGSSPRRTADAVYHAAQHARVINMSWVYGIDYQVLRDVVRSATAPESLGGFDCVLVGGAGNAPNAETHLDVQWPALYDSVLAVGSMTQSVDLWNLSAYGPYVGSVSLVAPVGEGIPAHSHDSCPGPPIACPDEAVRPCNSHIVLFKGTSGAAPQVAGVAALIRARFPDLNQFQVKQRILRSAEFYWEDTTENRKKFGAGKLNAYRALTEWGEISGEVTWSPSKTRDGKYYISGDLTIPAGASLTIDPGTIVKVAPDNEAGGTDTDRVEIVVEGELNIGTSGDPVIFESFTDSDPTSADWVGIRIVAGSETSGLDNLIIRNAQVAIENEVALELGDVKLEDCESAVLGADVKVKTDGKLTVAPGMVFWVGPDEDGGGVDPDWVEFVVDGELSISRGTGPTVFKSSAGTPTNKDWLGIWVSEGATATMENVEIRNAYQAIGTRSTLTVRKGHIEDCARIGLSIGGDGQGQADFTVTADTLTIRNVPGTGGLPGIGVNLLGEHATLQLTNSVIENSDWGVLAYTDATLSMSADSVRGHSLWGVGVFYGAGATMTGVTVEGNTYLGIKAYDGASVTATGCTFASNDWGAYVTPEGGTDPTVSFSECTFAENEEGVRVASTSNVTLSDCDVLDQTSAGVYCLGGADISVTDYTLIDGNAAGISCDQSSPEIVWNKIQYNVAGISGEQLLEPTGAVERDSL